MVGIYNFTRSASYSYNISNPVTGVDNHASVFKLNDLAGYAEIVNLFDCYRITQVDLSFVPSWDSSNKTQPPNADTVLPTLATVEDHNDALALSTRAEYMQYSTYKERTLSASVPINISIKPTPAMALYGGGVFASYGQSQTPWVDTGSYTVEHYGLKWAVIWPVAGTGNLGGYLTVFARFHIQTKDTR